MGITQHRHGSENIQQIANLLLLRGNFGKPGAGICPVRGHSNVQGDRTVGVDEKPKQELLDQIEKIFGFKPPQRRGHAVVDAVQAMIEGRAKVFVGLGCNFITAVPDKPIAEAAMRRLRSTVAISTKLNRGHLVHGEQALILPCLARSDIDMQTSGRQAVTVEDSMSMVHASAGLVHPPSKQLKSEVAIVCGMAKATLRDDGIDWSKFEANYDVIRDRIEDVFPDLFRDFNRRIRQPGGFHLPIPPRERIWKTPTGRANFLIFEGVAEDPAIEHAAALRLATLRSHNQYNTTIYGLDDRYRGVFGGRMVVFMNETDMRERDIAARRTRRDRSAGRRRTETRGARLQGQALRHSTRVDRRLLPGSQSAASSVVPRCEKQDARSEIDSSLGEGSVTDHFGELSHRDIKNSNGSEQLVTR